MSSEAMREFGVRLGRVLKGGDVVELVGDVGVGKTTLTKGIAAGMGIHADVQSPTFTISRVYEAHNGLALAHYDFYRLVDAGIMGAELYESVHDAHMVTVLEWASIVAGVLPTDTLVIRLEPVTETSRMVRINAGGDRARMVLEQLR